MRSQIFAGLAFGLAAMAAAAPAENSTSEEQVTIDAAVFVREDANRNDNWDSITSAGFSLVTSSGSIGCKTNGFPEPSKVFKCADPAYSFEIVSRPGYNLYTVAVSHKVSDRYVSSLFLVVSY
jgi:hypothetical protein